MFRSRVDYHCERFLATTPQYLSLLLGCLSFMDATVMARGYTEQVSQESIQEDGKITQKRTIPFPSLNHNTQEEEEKKHKGGKKAALLSWAHTLHNYGPFGFTFQSAFFMSAV